MLLDPRSSLPSPLADYEKLAIVGKGSFGTAILCRRRRHGDLIILKHIDLQAMSPEERKSATREAQLLSEIRHENIVQYFDCHCFDGQLYIEMEYCEAGTLCNFLSKQSRPLLELDVLSIFKQIASALAYLEEKRILHRDLKTSNIFLAKHHVIKVGDFGIAIVLSGTKAAASTVIGTATNFSPEVCEGKKYAFKTDIWALGCILYEIMTLRPPFDASSLPLLIRNIVSVNVKPISGPYSRSLKNLLYSLLSKDPDKRPKAHEVYDKVDDLMTEELVNRYQNPFSSFAEFTGYAINFRTLWSNRLQKTRSLLFELILSPRIHLERLNLPYGSKLKQISKSLTHTLLLTEDESVYQILKNTSKMVELTCLRGKDVWKVAAGNGFSLFLSRRGLTMLSGADPGLVIPDGHLDDDPVVLDSLISCDISDIACSSNHAVACCSEGYVYVWGRNNSSCLGLGPERMREIIPEPELLPFPRGTQIDKVFCCEDVTAFIDRKKRLWVVGSNEFKKLGRKKRFVHRPVRLSMIREPVESVSLSKFSCLVQLVSGKVIILGARSKNYKGKSVKMSRGKVVELGNGITKSTTTGLCDLVLTVESEICFWGKRATGAHRMVRDVSRTASTTSECLRDENIIVGESDVSLMEIVKTFGPDNPVILLREPKLIAKDMKQLESVSGEEELCLHPQLIMALYSSRSHLRLGETISVSNLFTFEDDSIYIVIDTNIEVSDGSCDSLYEQIVPQDHLEGQKPELEELREEVRVEDEAESQENELNQLHEQLMAAKREKDKIEARMKEIQKQRKEKSKNHIKECNDL